MNKILKGILRWIANVGMVLLLIAAILLTGADFILAGMIERMIVSANVEVSQDTVEATKLSNADLAEEIEGEGIVLLQNNDKTLPLSTDITRVNVFGWSATQWIGGGSGSGQITSVDTDFLASLKEAGISYNEELINMYQNFQPERPFFSTGALHTYDSRFCRLYEPDINDTNYYSQEILDDALAYSDTALVILGRVSGESIDCPKVQYKQTTKDGEIVTDNARTYLNISAEEEALLDYAGANYKNVIVIVNSTNAMALGEIETIEGIDSCLLVGCTGSSAAGAIPKVLYGEINPSGRTTDTYAFDLSTSAAYANFGIDGEGLYTNGDGLYPADGTANGNVGTNEPYAGVSYIDYAENIYIGYKWYETADAEGFWADISNNHGTGYDGVVQYPFGYGLSYTDFKWELISTSVADNAEVGRNDEIEVTVKVTNVGDKAGKDVVELYAAPPYTTGGIEKASTSLCAYAKTGLLQPGESEEIVLSFVMDDLTSYDAYDVNENGFKGYELEAGNYGIQLKKDAHTLADMGDDAILNLNVSSDIFCDTDLVTGNKVENRFTGEDAEDGISIDGSDSGANITYLTRADFKGTFPSEKTVDRAMTDNLINSNLYTEEMAEAWIDETDEAISTGADNGLSVMEDGQLSELGIQLGNDYNDPQWDALLDQMSIKEMMSLVLHGYVGTGEVKSIGKPVSKEIDGPAQFGSFSTGIDGTGFPNPTTVAQTWNNQLGYEMGQSIANEAGNSGYDGWYAPSTNMHRTTMGGRNYEYYSEDSLLAGEMTTQVVSGSLDKGIYCYIKHFIVYDQDTNRDSLYTWLTEQSLREIYLKPFEMAVEEGGATGIMTSYNRLGAVWAGGSEALLTEVLRNEWGFHGAVLTDYSDHQIFMNMDQALRAGGNIWMDGFLCNGSFMYETQSNSFNQALRKASKGIIYMWLNANVRNQEYAADNGDTYLKPVKTPGLNYINIIVVVVDIAAIGLFILWIRSIKKRMKARRA